MVKEVLHGQMEENTKVSILMIKKKEKELSLGTMVVCTMDIGLTENLFMKCKKMCLPAKHGFLQC